MGIALLTFSSLLQGFAAIQRRAAPARARVNPSPLARTQRFSSSCHRAASAAKLLPRAALTPVSAAPTPLRVVRLSEGGERPGSAGRMVISGRMADVCAELDRLVAREAAALGH